MIVNSGGILEAGNVNSRRILLAGTLSSGSLSVPLTLTGNATLAPDIFGISINGTITDNGNGFGLTVSGPGRAELNGANNFSGPVNVTGGVLSVSTLLPSATTVQAGGTATKFVAEPPPTLQPGP